MPESTPIRIDDAAVAAAIQARANSVSVVLTVSMFCEDPAGEDGDLNTPDQEARLTRLSVRPRNRQRTAGPAHSDEADCMMRIEFLQGAEVSEESTLKDKAAVMRLVEAFDERTITDGDMLLQFERVNREYGEDQTQSGRIRACALEVNFLAQRNTGTSLTSP